MALGTGFNSIQGNLTVAKSSDPVVFFGNLSYTANLKGNHTVSANDPNNPAATMVGHFNPGDAIGFQLGSILALNPEVSMTLGWDQRFTRSTSLNGVDIPSSYLVEGTLRLGNELCVCAGKDDRSKLWRGAYARYAESSVLGGRAVSYGAVGAEAEEARCALIRIRSGALSCGKKAEPAKVASSRKLISRRMVMIWPKVCRSVDVLAAGAEVGESEMTGTGEFKARGDDRSVEVDDGAELDLDPELHGGGRECSCG